MARYMALLIADGVVERHAWKWRMADMSDFPLPSPSRAATCVGMERMPALWRPAARLGDVADG